MTSAWVISGGASLGSIQVGMARALHAEGLTPDLIVGTSVGALNGAWLAGGDDVDELEAIWRGLHRHQLFPVRPVLGLRAFLGRSRHFVPDSGLRRLLEAKMPHDSFEDLPIPFSAIAADVMTGEEVVLRSGSLIDAVVASAALPGVFPPVELDGRLLIDGGIANNTLISTAIEQGATEVWVLTPGYSCQPSMRPASAVELSLRAVGMLVEQRFISEVGRRHYEVPVHLIPAPCPIAVSPIDFSQSQQLMDRAFAGTRQWLANGRPNAIPLHPISR